MITILSIIITLVLVLLYVRFEERVNKWLNQE